MTPEAISNLAELNVVPTGVAATHAVQSYTVNGTGGTVSIANQFSHSGSIAALQWSVVLPTGWSLANTDASGASAKPAAGNTSLLEWTWTALPTGPVTFSYSLNLPAANAAPRPIAAMVGFNHNGTLIRFTAKIDPLMIGMRHSADTMGASAGTAPDGRINLAELLRVIELYNHRAGTVRTGQYTMQSGTEDDFAPGPNGAAVTAFHSADRMGTAAGTARVGRINLAELLRVIELYNYRAGTVRTGQYRLQAGTEDGFAPGL